VDRLRSQLSGAASIVFAGAWKNVNVIVSPSHHTYEISDFAAPMVARDNVDIL